MIHRFLSWLYPKPKPLPSREITPYRVPHKDRYL